MVRHYIQAFRATLQKIKAEDNTYIKSENIIIYDPDRIISEIPNNGLITKQNALDLMSGEGASSLDIQVPAGSAIPFSVLVADLTGYESGFTGYTQKMIISTTQNRYINDIRVDENWIDDDHTSLTGIDIYGHPNNTDGLTTQDDLIITLFK